MKIVRFLKNDLPYISGEVAGFQDHVAAKLISTGFAELHNGGAPKKTGEKGPPLIGEFGYEAPERQAKA